MIRRFQKITYSWLILFSLIAILLALTACRTSKISSATGQHFRDTTKMITAIDTILVKDSIFIREFVQSGEGIDTVFVKEYRTQYKYKVRLLHDTIAIVVRDSVPIYTTSPVVQQGEKSDSGTSIFGIVFAIITITPLTVVAIKYLASK